MEARHRLAPLALLLPAGAYLATLLPGPGLSGDSAELALCGHVLGVPHPTGYPLYVLALHAFDSAVPWGTPATRANLLSAVCALFALALHLRIQRELGARPAAALAGTLALAFTPSFWTHAVAAEVYAPHALLYAATLALFLRYARSARRRDLYLACAVYALGFGNHLLLVTLLPALALLVWTTDRRVFRDARSVAIVAALVALGASQYAFLLWRGAPGAAPYRAAEIAGLSDLVAFATGRQFQGSMFAFGPGALVTERLPIYASSAWSELGPLVAVSALGATALGLGRAGVLLALAFLGNLVFALGYDITDLPPYFLPNHLVAALWLGLGVERLAAWRPGRLVPAAAIVASLALAPLHAARVERESGPDAARRAALIVDELEAAVVVLGYHDFQFVSYYKLAEGRGSGALFPAHLVETPELVAYLRERRPLALPAFGVSVPPGLPVFSAKLNHREAYLAAGLRVTPWKWGILRLEAGEPAAAALEPGR